MLVSSMLLAGINGADCGFPTTTVKLDGISVAGDGYFAGGSCKVVHSNQTETDNKIRCTPQIVGFDAVCVAIDRCMHCPWHGSCLIKAPSFAQPPL